MVRLPGWWRECSSAWNVGQLSVLHPTVTLQKLEHYLYLSSCPKLERTPGHRHNFICPILVVEASLVVTFTKGQRVRVRTDGPEYLAPSGDASGVSGTLLSPAGLQPPGLEPEPSEAWFVELDNDIMEPIHVDWLELVESGSAPNQHCSVCGHGPESHILRVCRRCGQNEQRRIPFDWAPAHEFTF